MAHFKNLDFLYEKWGVVWPFDAREIRHSYEAMTQWCRDEGFEHATKRDKTIFFPSDDALALFLLRWK